MRAILYFDNIPKRFSLVTFDIFLTTSRRIVNLVLLYAQYFFFSATKYRTDVNFGPVGRVLEFGD